MGIIVVNSDFGLLWNEPYPEIQFDNTAYSLAGEVGTKLEASFTITDNNDEDVTDQCVIALSNQYVSIEDGKFVCEGLEVGTYTTTATATYAYKSATVQATATINISVDEEQATSISFGDTAYALRGDEDAALSTSFSVSDNLGNDITTLCSYTFSPNDKGVYAEGGYFKVDSAIAGTYNITATATYGQLTNTTTIECSVEAIAHSISFDSNSYTMSGTEYETITQSFTVTDDLGNNVTSQAVITFNNAYVTASNGTFTVDNTLSAGSYSTTATATYGSLTATATISITLAASVPTSIEFDDTEYLLSGDEGNIAQLAFTVTDDLYNTVTSQCTFTFSPNNTGLVVSEVSDYYVFDASSVSYGTYSVTVTATYDGLTATATVNMEIVNPYAEDYLTFEALESGTFTLTIGRYLNSTYMTSVSYSTDNGTTWVDTAVDNTDQTITTPTIAQGDTVLWKGEGKGISRDNDYGSKFSSTGNFNVSGNIMSLMYGDNFANQTSFPSGNSGCNCYGLFKNAIKLISAENLVLPATTLIGGCYENMFNNCQSLTKAPALPATTVAYSCYSSMFYNCALTTAPVLPATTLATSCYEEMFNHCTSLTTAPVLPATETNTKCYKNMFKECTSLTAAPVLPATIGASSGECYNGMFDGCTALTTAPEISATTALGYYFCKNMFRNCSNLSYIKAMFTFEPGANYTENWVANVAATGTFVKNAAAEWEVSGANGIPTGWTVQTANA